MNDREHLSRIHDLPCMICLLWIGVRNTQVEAHHIGDSSERSDWLTIPLCPDHHRGPNGFHGAGERAFNRMYKTNELQLLGMTIKELAK